MKKKEELTTFEKEMRDPEFRKGFEEEYKRFLLSEIMLEMMEKKKFTVRRLAAEAGLSPTVIQDLRSDKRKNATLSSISSLLKPLGGSLVIKDGKKEYALA